MSDSTGAHEASTRLHPGFHVRRLAAPPVATPEVGRHTGGHCGAWEPVVTPHRNPSSFPKAKPGLWKLLEPPGSLWKLAHQAWIQHFTFNYCRVCARW